MQNNRRCLVLISITGVLIFFSGCRTILKIIDVRKTEVKIEEESELAYPEFGKTWIIPDIGIALEPIEPGTFIMGSLNESNSNSNPWHYVTLSKTFWMGRHEVNQDEYTRVVENNPSRFVGHHKPVDSVTWFDAERFCMVLTVLERGNSRLPEGYIYRLPTEAEFEFCCRAGTEHGYSDKLITVAWYNVNSGSTSHDVGIKSSNNFGLYDVLGNVAEWCLDREGVYPQKTVIDPKGPHIGTSRIIRGGSWFNSEKFCTPRYRYFMDAKNSNHYVGFRIVLAPGELKFKYTE